MSATLNEQDQWADEATGELVVNGFVFYGDQNLDPVLNPLAGGIFSDRALTIALSNPQRTGADGRTVNKVWLSGRYSLKLEDVNNVQLYQELDVGENETTGTTSLTNVQGTNTITADGVPTVDALVNGQLYVFIPVITNTGAVTLQIDSTAAKAVEVNGGALTGNELAANITVAVAFNSGADVFDMVVQVNRSALGLGSILNENQFRLSLTTGVPVTTTDVTAAGTIFMTPYTGKDIALFTGSVWDIFTLPELSIAASTSANTPFDIFCDHNGGTPVLRITDWTNDTTRAITLTTQDGILVQTGNLDFRYLGTARTKTASQVDDALTSRHLWNYYNRVKRAMRAIEATDTWTYTLATIRQANANTANQLDFVIGVSEDIVEAYVSASVRNDTVPTTVKVGIGLDSTTVFTGKGPFTRALINDVFNGIFANFNATVAIGRHFLSWNENSVASGITTWAGDGGVAAELESSISGSIFS